MSKDSESGNDGTSSDEGDGPSVDDDSFGEEWSATESSSSAVPFGSPADTGYHSGRDDARVTESKYPADVELYCSDCGCTVESGVDECPECDASGSLKPSAGRNVYPIFSTVCSFVLPGLGQIFNGQRRRGMLVLGGWFGWMLFLGAVWLFVTVISVGFLAVTFVLIPIFEFPYHVGAAVDAYVQARRIKRGEKVP